MPDILPQSWMYMATSASFRTFWCVLICRRASRYRRFEDRVVLIFRVTQSKKSAAWTPQWRHYGPSTGPAIRYHYIPENLVSLVCSYRRIFIWSNVHSRDTTNRCLIYVHWNDLAWHVGHSHESKPHFVLAQRTLAANDTTCVTQRLSVSSIINN